jgi:hypothetical protein
MMRGITITLKTKTKTGTDPFNRPVYTTSTVDVSDVLVGEPTADDVSNAQVMYGKKVSYCLAIPKGDTNVWEDTEVILPEPFAGTYHTIGYPTAGIEENIPLRWNKKVLIERMQNG